MRRSAFPDAPEGAPAIADWTEIEAGEPALAAQAKACFDAHLHKTLATLRRDGSPRISGIELIFAQGDVWFGSMPAALKARDLQRDPRYAVHSGSMDPPAWSGDAKLAGAAEEVFDQAVLEKVMAEASAEAQQSEPKVEEMHLFRLGVGELVWTGLNEAGDKLVIDSWHRARGRRTIER